MPSTRNPSKIGHIEGFPVGYRWKDRQKLSDDGVHAPVRAGIHGRQDQGAFSLVLSGGYDDDHCDGNEFIYTGSGGNVFSLSSKRLVQVRDQEWQRGNRALQRSMELNRPVRVIRGSGLNSRFAPHEGYRYDGLYKVVSATTKAGKYGHLVCLFQMKRCPDQLPLPVSPALVTPSRPTSPESEPEMEIVATNFVSTTGKAGPSSSSIAQGRESETTGQTSTVVGSVAPATHNSAPGPSPPAAGSTPIASSSRTQLSDKSLPACRQESSSNRVLDSNSILVGTPPTSRTLPIPRENPLSTPVASTPRVQIPQKRPRPRSSGKALRWWAKRAKRMQSIEGWLEEDDSRPSTPTRSISRAASPSMNRSACPPRHRKSVGAVFDEEWEENMEGMDGYPGYPRYHRGGKRRRATIEKQPVDVIDRCRVASSASLKGKGKAVRIIDLTLDSDEDEVEGGDVRMTSSARMAHCAGGTRVIKEEEVRLLEFFDLTADSDGELDCPP